MDERINKALKELKDAIRSCEDYKSFCAVKAEVDAEPELRRQIDDFRLRCFQLHNERADNPDFAELDRFSQESFEFRKNPLVDEYLKRELRVCRMLQEIGLETMDAIDLGVQSFADRLKI